MATTLASSGTTGIATVADAAVEVLPFVADQLLNNLVIINESAVVGFFSVDGGTIWCRLPANCVLTVSGCPITGAVQLKRVAGGSNVTAVFAWAWRGRS
jgi:hypothetical protein